MYFKTIHVYYTIYTLQAPVNNRINIIYSAIKFKEIFFLMVLKIYLPIHKESVFNF